MSFRGGSGPVASLALLALAGLAGAGNAQPPPEAPGPAIASPGLALRRIPPPSDGPASWPSIARGEDGRTRITWIERLGARRAAVRLATLDGERWTGAATVAESDDLFVNWADFPSVAAGQDGTVAVHWPEKLEAGTYAYGVRVACSRDGGRTWSEPFWLHDDTSANEHGFASLVPWGGGFAAVWLDARPSDRPGDMALRARTIDAEGRRGGEIVLDPRVCECCCTAAAAAGGALLAVYRDRSDDEVRDLSIARAFGPEPAAAPRALHADGWENPG